jgi:hypothetical protein
VEGVGTSESTSRWSGGAKAKDSTYSAMFSPENNQNLNSSISVIKRRRRCQISKEVINLRGYVFKPWRL